MQNPNPHEAVKHSGPLRVLIYDIFLPEHTRAQVENRMLESHQLITTYGGKVLESTIQRRHHRSTWGCIGYHKFQELIEQAYHHKANLLLINQALKAKQIHNLEKSLETFQIEKKMPKVLKIWDRVDLIINIFSKHAKTAEARLQLELARIEHFGPRIYGMGEDLSQQGGGIGTRGLGETNTEIMKRHLSHRKKLIRKKIDKLAHTQSVHRNRRSKNGVKTIALVGYTNTGKSALFKALSGKTTYVQDELFATLHTLSARMDYRETSGSSQHTSTPQPNLVIVDTIGFIEELPPKLINAFRSTLEDTLAADMLLHVIDISDKNFRNKMAVVQSVLKDLKADTIPRLMIFNKIDNLSSTDLLYYTSAQEALSDANNLFISAKTGHNIPLLKKQLFDFFTSSTLNPMAQPFDKLKPDKLETDKLKPPSPLNVKPDHKTTESIIS